MEPPLIRQVGCSEEPVPAPGHPTSPALLGKQPPRSKRMLYYFKVIGHFPIPTENSYFLNINLSVANAPRVKTTISAP